MKKVFGILTLIAFASCSRHVIKHKSQESFSTENKHVFVDTSMKSLSSFQDKTTRYGDTLKSSLFFPLPEGSTGYSDYVYPINYDTASSIYSDSIESNGIKIKVGIVPQHGGIKLHVNAVAKPVETHEITATNTTEKKGVSDSAAFKKEGTITHMDKDTKQFDIVPIIVALIIVGGLIFLYYKYFPHGKV